MFVNRNHGLFLAAACFLSLAVAGQLMAQQPNPTKQPKPDAPRPVEQRVQHLTFDVAGIDNEAEADQLTKAFLEAGLKPIGKAKIGKANFARIVVAGGSETDLAATCMKVCTAMGAKEAKETKSEQGMALVLFAKLDERSANEAMTALQKIERVDANKSRADVSAGEVHVAIAWAGAEKRTPAKPADAPKADPSKPDAPKSAAAPPTDKPSTTARPLTVATILHALNTAGIVVKTEAATTATSG